VRAFTASLDPNRYLVLYLANPTTGLTGIYRDLLLALGYEPPFSRPRMITRLRQAFTDLATTKRRLPLVILDEAHLLEPALLEPLRLLFSDQMREAASPWPPSSWSASPRCIARFTSRSMKPSTNA
jgi:type II secretory pathway predicted ATPase ExeA